MWKLSIPGVLSIVGLVALLASPAPAHAQCTDNDGDGYGDPGDVACPSGPETDCDDDDAAVNPGAAEILCNNTDDDCDVATLDVGDGDGDGVDCDTDCDDTNPDVYPGAVEACDGLDTDCVDGPGPTEVDTDADGWLACLECDDADATLNLDDADGDGFSTCHDDCDDAEAAAFPGNPEICDGLDNDCDETTDEEVDGDGDGLSVCDGDCDDTDETVYPGAPEICDGGIDNDCDFHTDEEVDDDLDGYSECDGDCDDSDDAINPDATETCNGLDDNCDDVIDEGFDEDEDTYTVCGEDGEEGTPDDDCDDADATINPGAEEICDDGLDNNCDDLTDDQDEENCGNAVPVADAGYDQQSRYLAGQVTLSFDGSGSEDAEGTNLTYVWEVTEFPDGVEYHLVSSTTSPYAFLVVTVTDASAGGPWDFVLSLVVTDEDNNQSEADYVKGHIFIDDPMMAPGRCDASASGRPAPAALVALLGGAALLALRRR